MKKQFFYAAMAVALMASCSSEDDLALDPVNPTPDEEKVALQLGIDAPSVNATVGSRGTGSVGDVAGDNNKWNNQQLFITMIDRATGDVAKENNTPILGWDSYEYIAPRATDQTADDLKGNIRIYQKNTYNKTEGESDKGTIQYLYYPVSGKFDFYGWHLDGALAQTATNPAIAPHAESATNAADGYPVITLSDITIDGTQDIMAAKTTDRSQDATVRENNLSTWLYSARTARNEVHPVLKFEHKLARLKFFVRAGSDETALKNVANNHTATPALKVAGDHTSTGAMYVTGIRALNMINKFNMTLDNEKTIATAGTATTGSATFNLGDKLKATYDESTKKVGEIDTLVAVAPEWFWKYNGKPADYKGTPVGESIMFLPEGSAKTSISFQMDLKQYVQLTDDETTANDDKWGYKRQLNAPFTIDATHVKKTDAEGNTVSVSEFKAGESYNVYITIYGFERIEVSAELTAWEMGGDVDVDIEEGESSTPGDETTETVKATFKITELTPGVEATVTLNNGENKKANANAEGTASVEFTVNKGVAYTYTVTAEGYNNATGELDATETANNDFEETVEMSVAQVTPETEQVTFTITNLPQDQTATITIMKVGGNDVVATLEYPTQNTFEAEVSQTYNYTVSSTNFEEYTEGTFTTNEPSQSITLEAKTKEVTINITDQSGYTDVQISVADEEGESATLKGGTTYILTYGKSYTVSITGTDSESQQKENSATFIVGDSTPEIFDIAFDNAGGGSNDRE